MRTPPVASWTSSAICTRLSTPAHAATALALWMVLPLLIGARRIYRGGLA